MRNSVIALTLENLKGLKHAEFNKGTSIMHKTTKNQRYIQIETTESQKTNESSSCHLAGRTLPPGGS